MKVEFDGIEITPLNGKTSLQIDKTKQEMIDYIYKEFYLQTGEPISKEKIAKVIDLQIEYIKQL